MKQNTALIKPTGKMKIRLMPDIFKQSLFVDISFLDNPVGIVVLTFVLAFVCCAIILGLIEMGVPGKYIGYD